MATPVDAGSIFSDVRIRLDKLQSDLNAVNTGFDKLGTSLRANSDKTTKTQTDNFKKVELAGTVAITAITIAFKKSVSVFAQTEQSLANVEAVSNATAAEFRELEEAAEAAGTTTRFTAGQAADALFFLSSAGLNARESVEALDGVLKLAGATGSDLAKTAQAVTSTLSQFDLAASDSAKVANIFAAANSNSQATLDKLQNSLRQVGPVAAGLDIELEEVVGSLQALFNAGFQGESAGRALKSALADLANEASPTIEKLEALGISFADVNPEAVGLTNAIGALEEANLSTAQVIDAFGKVAGPQLVTLIKTGEAAITEYTEAVTDTNEAARQYEVQNDTLSGSIDALKSAIEGTSNSFIEELAPALRFIIDTFTTILRVVNKVPDVLKGAGIGAGVAAGGFIALSKALALIGITLSTGPLAIIAGIGALTIGLTSMVRKAQEARDIRLSEEFGDLARELGFAGQAIDEFTGKAGGIEKAFLQAGKFQNSLEDVTIQVGKLSEAFGLTEDQIIAIGFASENVSEEYKKQLVLLQKQIAEQQIIEELSDTRLLTEEKIELRRLAQLEAARKEAETAREKAEAQRAEEERAERLEEIKERILTLDELAIKGAITESEALEEKKALREEEIALLLDQALVSGNVTDEIVANIERQQDAIDRYAERLEVLKEEEVSQTDQAKEEAKKQARAWEELSERREERHREQLEKDGEAAEEAAAEEEALLERRKQAHIRMYESISGAASNFFSALVGLSQALTESQISEINKAADAEINAIDKRTQATLEALGLAEETQIESLQKRLDAAIAAGDEETANELEQEIARTEIINAAELEKQEIAEKAAQEARRLEREQAIRNKALQIFQAGINTASAIIGFLANPGGIPGVALSVAAGLTGAAQIAAISATPLPELQTGGIILPSPGGTAAVLAENGAAELALNAGSEGEALLGQFAKKINEMGGGGGTFTLILERDGKREAQAVVDYINNGVVRVEI